MKKTLFLLFFLFLIFPSLFAQTFTGTAIKIADGDTFTLLTHDKKLIRVRLYGIDCPERSQPFGYESSQFTAKQLKGRIVRVEQKYKDRYNRVVGMVYMGNRNLNTNLLKAGLAWHYTTYDKNKKWAKLENRARISRKGLWADDNPISPWNYRKNLSKVVSSAG